MSIAEGAKALIEESLLNGAALGIAERIATTNSLIGLSEKQIEVYKRYIEPHFSIVCQSEDCEFEIDIEFIADAIRDQQNGNSVLCQHCIYINDLNARDD